MNWGRLARELELSRKERIGILVLAFLVMVSLFLPYAFEKYLSVDPVLKIDTMALVENRDWEKDSLFIEKPEFPRRSYRGAEEPVSLTPFHFDPNTLDEKGWQRLGLPDRTIKTILNYRNKGGRFRDADDLGRIYGLRAEHFSALEPYIQIVDISRLPNTYERTKHKERPAQKIDVNLSDTTGFIGLPGIGSKLALRIIAFREKLGGFHNMDQLKEVYGLADSVFQKIRPYLLLENAPLKKLNINTATEEELKAHPYIRYVLAKPIIAYRNAHGNFSSVDDLKKVMAITPEQFEKIKPYVKVE